MKIYCENDVITLQESVAAEIIGEQGMLVIPVGTKGTVVLVHGNPENPVAYEVEFYNAEKNCYALASVEARNI